MSAALLALLPPNPCEEGRAWVEELPESTTRQWAWRECPVAGWKMWWLSKQPHTVASARAMAACARELALAVVGIHDRHRPERALGALLEALPMGAANVAAASRVASASLASRFIPAFYAAVSCSRAADAAYAADSAIDSAYAADAAADAAAWADYAAEANPSLRAELIDIVRRHFPTCPLGGTP